MPALKQTIPAPQAVRAYLGVYCYTDDQGSVTPVKIRWEDGREWDIDRVLEVRPAVARKAGGVGIRYLVQIGHHQRELFWTDGRWFTEVSV